MIRFKQELFTIEKDKNMPYVDTLTRMSREEGSLAQARESVIEALKSASARFPTTFANASPPSTTSEL